MYIAVIIGIILLCLVLIFVVKEMKHCKGTSTQVPDFLLILGCRVRGDKAEETLMMRIVAAAEYLEKHPEVIAIPCGGIVHDDQTKSEAAVIAENLIDMGIEKDRIIPEDKSLTTVQNFVNAKKIIQDLGGDTEKIAFLSSDFHLFRASVIAEKCSVRAESVAAASPRRLKLKNYVREFFCFPAVIIG